jgi:hypothetical protein
MHLGDVNTNADSNRVNFKTAVFLSKQRASEKVESLAFTPTFNSKVVH